jgi:hypothetical protein
VLTALRLLAEIPPAAHERAPAANPEIIDASVEPLTQKELEPSIQGA